MGSQTELDLNLKEQTENMDDYRSGEIIPTERKEKHKKDIVSLAIDEN